MTSSLLIAALGVALHAVGHAAPTESDALMATLKQHYPNTTFTSIAPSPVKGVYEVVMGHKIAYTDKTGRYFMYGSLVDMQTNDDLTAARHEALMKVDVSKLPIQDAIVRVNGNGRRVVYVFSDPDCPFCRRLEPELDKLEDTTFYIFLYPIDQLHPDAGRKARSIWCETDPKARGALWHHAVTGGDPVATRDCDNPVKRTLTLGQSLGIQGTPTLIAADGRMLPGMLPAQGIEEWLSRTKSVATTAANK